MITGGKEIVKKLLGVTLSLAMVASLAACGTSTPKDGKATTQSTEKKAEDKKADADTKTDTKDVFTIGAIGPLTGSAASYGTSVKNATEIAIDEINAAGGVKVGDKNVKLALDFQDDQAKEDQAVTAYNKLMSDGMDVLLGCVTSGSSLAVTSLSAQDKILQITPSGSAADITANDNVFRLCFTDPLQGKTLADFVAGKDYSKIAILYNNADEYSTGIKDAFKEELKAKGKDSIVVDEESFKTEDVDYTTQLTKIKNAGAEAIFVPAYYQAAAYITQQAKSAGMNTAFIGSDGWDGVIAQVTDKSAVEGAVFLSPFLASDPSAKKFVDAYKAKYNATPDQFAADGYDTVYVIKAALEKAGSTKSEDLIAAMTQIEVDGLTGKVTFDASGEPNKEAKFVTITNGEYVPYQAK